MNARLVLAFAPLATSASLVHSSEAFANIPVPSNYKEYCSWISTANSAGEKWRFTAVGADPCGSTLDANIRAAGYYDTVGANQAFARCGSSLSSLNTVYRGTGAGYNPVSWVIADMHAGSHEYCELKVSPLALPVFSAPFPVGPLPDSFAWHHFVFNPAVWNNSGYHHSLDINSFGQTAYTSAPYPSQCSTLPSPLSCVAETHGRDLSWSVGGWSGGQARQYTNIERASDVGLAAGTPLRAMGDGQIIARRFRETPGCVNQADPQPEQETQGEIYILYRVGEGRYTELFMSYYAHVQDWDDENGVPIVGGALVSRGDVVGHVGNTGCSGGPHLHYSLSRLSNTTRAESTTQPWRYPWNPTAHVYGDRFFVGSNQYSSLPDNIGRVAIDPSGWNAPEEMDPGGYMFYNAALLLFGPNEATEYGMGAASINLWLNGRGYPRPCDADATFWLKGGLFQQNPYRTCL